MQGEGTLAGDLECSRVLSSITVLMAAITLDSDH
jgi:hypothetical protein